MTFVLLNDLQSFVFPNLTRTKPNVLQVNLGYKCNMSCNHCHVEASPQRK